RARTRCGCGRWGRAIEARRIVVGLASDGRPALGADVVVLVAARQDQQELLADRSGSLASRAEEAGGLELLEAVTGTHARDCIVRRSRRRAEPTNPDCGPPVRTPNGRRLIV